MLESTHQMKPQYGIRANLAQFILQLTQVFLVGLTIGMMRTVVPALAEEAFGLQARQFTLLASFVVVFGLVKAVMNLLAGHWSDRYGRKRVLITGWLFALPVPWMIATAESWNWIVAATLLLGVQQGLCWSMALNSKLDMTRPEQKGLVNGLNEFAGYAAVALAGIGTAWLAERLGAREGLAWFGSTVILTGLLLSMFTVKETRAWIEKNPANTVQTGFWTLFIRGSWTDRRLMALSQAGLVEKFADALIWIFLPVFLVSRGLDLVKASSVIAVYGLVWGASQLVTGPWSDRIGRKPLITGGLLLCALGLVLMPFSQGEGLWSLEAALVGWGMAMLYPTLGSAVADFSPAEQRSSLLGIYRFWRDFGYALAALAMGVLAQASQNLESPFYLAALALLLSAVVVQIHVPGRNQSGALKAEQVTEDPL